MTTQNLAGCGRVPPALAAEQGLPEHSRCRTASPLRASWQWTLCCAALGGAILGSAWALQPPANHFPSHEKWPRLSVAALPSAAQPARTGVWCETLLADGASHEILLPVARPGEQLSAIVLAYGAPTDRLHIELQRSSALSSEMPSRLRWHPVSSQRSSQPVFRNGFQPPSPALPHTEPEVVSIAPATRLLEYPKPGTNGFSPLDYEFVEVAAGWTGHGCRIWLPVCEVQDANLDHWHRLLGEFVDECVLPRVIQDQGAWPDVDGDGLVNIVVTERVPQLTPGVRAFVRKHDFQGAPDRAAGPVPWDVVHVQPGVPLDELEPILIHEFTHVAEFSWCQHLAPGGPWPIPDWLTEGLAHAAEMRNSDRWENTLPRLQVFAQEPQLSPLRVTDAHDSGLWRNPGQRGASAAFCNWWVQQNGGVDWPTLIRAFSETDDPWQTLNGISFAALFREWSVSLAMAGIPAGSAAGPIPVKRQTLKADQPLNLVLTGTTLAIVDLPGEATMPREYLQVHQTASNTAHVHVVLLRTPLSSVDTH